MPCVSSVEMGSEWAVRWKTLRRHSSGDVTEAAGVWSGRRSGKSCPKQPSNATIVARHRHVRHNQQPLCCAQSRSLSISMILWYTSLRHLTYFFCRCLIRHIYRYRVTITILKMCWFVMEVRALYIFLAATVGTVAFSLLHCEMMLLQAWQLAVPPLRVINRVSDTRIVVIKRSFIR